MADFTYDGTTIRPHFAVSHLTTLDYKAGRLSRYKVDKERQIIDLFCTLTVQVKGNVGNAAADEKQAGLLGLIKALYVQMDSGIKRYQMDGLGILMNMWRNEGTGPFLDYSGPVDGANGGTYTVQFPFRFNVPGLDIGDYFYLDTRSEGNGGSDINTIDLIVEWGDENDVWDSPNDTTVESASISFDQTRMFGPGIVVNGNRIRANQTEIRHEVINFGTKTEVELEIPRVVNSRLLGVYLVSQSHGKAARFGDPTDRIKTIHGDDDPWKSPTLAALQAEQERVRGRVGLPSNMLFVEMTEGFKHGTALQNSHLRNELNMFIPVKPAVGAADNDENVLNAYIIYSKAGNTK